MDSAQRTVEVIAHAQREAAEARLLRDRQTLRDAGLRVQRDDFLPGPHHLTRDAAAQVERVQHQIAAQRRAVRVLARVRHEQAQLLLGMRALALADRLDAQAAQQPEGGAVQRAVERIENQVEPAQRIRHPQRRRQRLLDRQRFGRKFSHDDVQKTDGRKPAHEGRGVPHLRRLHAQQVHHRVQQRGKHRLAHPAQAQAGQGDAELRGAQRGIQMLNQPPGHARAAVARLDQPLELRVADFDQRELRRHKEAVQQHQHQHQQHLEGERQHFIRVQVHRRTSPKITFNTSCNDTMPISCRSRPSTMARRCPVRCIWRRASSARCSPSRYSAGLR